MACLCYFMIYSRTTDFSTNKILRKVLCKMMKRKSFKNILNQIFYQSADNRDTLMSHRRIGFTTRVSLLFKCIMPMQVGNYLSFLIHLSFQLFFWPWVQNAIYTEKERRKNAAITNSMRYRVYLSSNFEEKHILLWKIVYMYGFHYTIFLFHERNHKYYYYERKT